MTYRTDYSLPADLLEQLAQDGFDALPESLRVVINTAMRDHFKPGVSMD